MSLHSAMNNFDHRKGKVLYTVVDLSDWLRY